MNSHHTPITRRARGFTFVEALVALLVLSIGLLGVAALQLTSLRSNHSSSLRSQATLLAYDIVDRMRANRTAALSGAYNLEPANALDDESTVIREVDLVRWRKSLSETLPSGVGSIESDIAGGITTITVTIQWDDARDPTDPMRFVMETQI
jgi:type IV pilus assembly protein PilV